ncbi:MAG: hypothetical protein C0616_12620, partial [Desulfuromonas sp.]
VATQVSARIIGQNLLSAEVAGTPASEILPDSETLHLLDPLSAEWYALAGRLEYQAGDPVRAVERFRTANIKRPFNRIILQSLGELLISQGRIESGLLLARAGAEQERMFPDGWRWYVTLLSQANPEESLPVFKRVIKLEPLKTRDYLTMMVLRGFTNDQIERALPDESIPWVSYGDYHRELGDEEAAEACYRTATLHALSSSAPSAVVFRKYAAFLVSRQRMAEAVDLLEQGCALLPNDPGLLLLYARYSEVVGLVRQAHDGYQRVLMIRPGHVEARRRLTQLEKEWTTL